MKIILAILITLILSGCYTQLHIVKTSPQNSPTTTPIKYIHSQTPYIFYHPSTVVYYPLYHQHTNIIVVNPQPQKLIQQPRSSGVSKPSTVQSQQPRSSRVSSRNESKPSQNTERTQRNRDN
jgi:ABC-type Fe3+-hydroxamate transport system substrate-binding protein